MNKELFKLSILLGKLSKKKERIEKELEELKLDSKVARYLELSNNLGKIKKDYTEAEKEQIFITCNCCNHLMVQTGYEVDYCEGRSYPKFGCIKCGIDQNLYDDADTFEEKTQLEYIKQYYPSFHRDVDLRFINHYDLLKGRRIFLELKTKNKDLTDKEIVELMKKDKEYTKLYERTTRIW